MWSTPRLQFLSSHRLNNWNLNSPYQNDIFGMKIIHSCLKKHICSATPQQEEKIQRGCWEKVIGCFKSPTIPAVQWRTKHLLRLTLLNIYSNGMTWCQLEQCSLTFTCLCFRGQTAGPQNSNRHSWVQTKCIHTMVLSRLLVLLQHIKKQTNTSMLTRSKLFIS